MSTKPKTVWFDGGWRWRVLNPHTCQHCGKRFASRQALKQHTAAQHDDTNRHIEPGRIRQAIPTRGGQAMSEPEMSFHKRLRVALAWSDISPMELSRRLGVTRQAVHGWTHQGKYPRSSHLVQIARETGFSIDWLMQSGDPFYQQPIIEELLSNNKLLANLLGQAGIELPPETRP